MFRKMLGGHDTPAGSSSAASKPPSGASDAQRAAACSDAHSPSNTSVPSTQSRSAPASPRVGAVSPVATQQQPRSASPSPLSAAPSSAATPAASASSASAAASTVAGLSVAVAPVPPPTILPTVEWGIYVSTLAGCAHAPRRALSPSVTAADAHKNGDDEAEDDEDEDDDSSNVTGKNLPVSLETARFDFPQAVCTSREEKHLLVADSSSIRHINTTRKVVGVLSRGVEGAAGLFRDSSGTIWLADTLRHAIRKLTPQGELLHVAGSQKGTAGYVNGSAMAARFRSPSAVCSNGKSIAAAGASSGAGAGAGASTTGKHEPLLIFVADAGNCCIRVLTEKGVVSTLAGAPPEKLLSTSTTTHSKPAASSSSSAAHDAASVASGDASVDDSPSSVRRSCVDGPVSMATFIRPVCVAFDHADDSLVVSDAGANALRRITAAGLVWSMAGCARTCEAGFRDGSAFLARFREPTGIAIDSLGRIFVADRGNNSIRVLTPAGFVHTIAGDGTPGLVNGSGRAARFYGPSGLALDPHGSLFVADTNNHVLRKIHFVTLPAREQRELGNTSALLQRDWAEWQAAAELQRKQASLHASKLERQILELKKELSENKKSMAAEFAKVRQEAMQMQMQFISSMQAITADRRT